MFSFELNQGPRRLEDFDVEELEAFIQRGRTLQARAMGRGLKALFRGAGFGKRPPAPRTGQGRLDWERGAGPGPGPLPVGAPRLRPSTGSVLDRAQVPGADDAVARLGDPVDQMTKRACDRAERAPRSPSARPRASPTENKGGASPASIRLA